MDLLSNSPAGTKPKAVDNDTSASAPVARYSSTDDMRREFGDYRVNTNTDNLCDSASSKEYGSNDMDGLYLTN